MDLTNNWTNKVDGVDDVLAEDINSIAESVIELEQKPEIEVEQDYNPLSENPQSGKAVAEAVSSKADIEYVNNNFANALKGNKNGRNGVKLDNVSPILHNVSVDIAPYNLINQEEFFSSGSYTINGDVGKMYTLTFQLKAGTDISGVESGIFDAFNGGMVNYNFIINDTIATSAVTITIEEGHTYTWDTKNANVSDIFESVSMVLDTPVSLQKYGKNLYNYPSAGNNGGVETFDLGVIDKPSTLSFTVNGIGSGTIQLKRNIDGVWTRIVYIASGGVLRVPTFVIDGKTTTDEKLHDFGEYQITTSSNTSEGYLTKVQLELGVTATEYEPYVEPDEWDGVPFVPTTTLIPDTNGVDISAVYNRDITAVIDAIEQAIANS